MRAKREGGSMRERAKRETESSVSERAKHGRELSMGESTAEHEREG